MNQEKLSSIKDRSFSIVATVINKLWMMFAFSLIFIAVIIASARLFSSEFYRFKPEIESFLSIQLNRPVTIQSISLVWPAQGPRIQLKNLELAMDKSQVLNSLVIANGNVAINLWKSIFYLEWITEDINFQGIQAVIDPELITESEQPNIAETEEKNTEIKANIINQWFLKQATIEIYDSFLLISSDENIKFSYALPVLTYHGGEKKRQIKAVAVTSSGSELEIKAEFNDTELIPDGIVDIYVLGQQINLEEFPASIFGRNLAQFSGHINLELWSQLKHNKLDNLIANVAVNKISNARSKDIISISPFQLVMNRESRNDWAFTTSDLKIKVNKEKLLPFKLSGNGFINTQTRKEQWNFKGLDIPLSVVGSLTKSYLPETVQDWLSNSNPQGKIDNLYAHIIFDEESIQPGGDFEVSFDVVNFNSKHWQNFPGLKNISANILLNQNSVKVNFESNKGELILTPSFRYPIPFNHLTGSLELYYDQTKTQFSWHQLFFDSTELQLKSTGILEFPKQGDGYMDIVALLENVDTAYTSRFLPTTSMSEELVQYLDDSIHQGRLEKATAIIRGPFSAYPFENDEGVFDIRAKISGMNFEFLQDWPAINNLSAELRFFGDQMLIKADKGYLAGVEIGMASAENIAVSDPFGSMMIHAKTISQDQAVMNLLQASPLSSIAESLSILKFDGELNTSVTIELPSDDRTPPIIDGTVNFNHSNIFLKQPGMPFKDIVGELKFNQQGLTTGQLNGQLWKQDFTIQLKGKNTEEKSVIDGEFKSSLGETGLTQLSGLQSKLLSNGLAGIDGKLKFNSNLVDNTSFIKLEFSSDLQGLSVDFPGIFKKNASQNTPVSVSFLIDQDETNVSGHLNNQFQFQAKRNNDNWKGTLTVGIDHKKNPLKLPEKNLWLAHLKLDSFDLTRWVELSSKLFIESNSSNNSQSPFNIELSTNHFSVAGIGLGSTLFKMDQQQQQQQLKFSLKSENIDALLTFPNIDGEPLLVDINSLLITPDEEHEKNNEKTLSIKQLDKILPQDFPYIKLVCRSCNYGKQSLGVIEFETIPAGNNLAIIGRWYADKIFENKFTGLWSNNGTQFSGQLSSENFEELEKFWEINAGIKDSKLETNFAIEWPGAPWKFDKSTVTGSISSSFGKGHIDEVSAKGAEVFSFLSLQNLKRRLTLDFEDVFDEGFFYDKISADFLLNDGKAYSNGVKIDGTAADVKMSGYIDLAHNQFNQHVVVTPKLSSSLPVLAGWAISPPTALVALLLDKLFLKPALDVVTRIDYKITGSLDKPEIIEIGKQQKEIKINSDSEKNLKNKTPTLKINPTIPFN